ncbi:SCP-like protein [Ancylostoma caninum]|uniref:SCP-like protein n=1 Tax=Ancylostoma caninum TaxID=29170 RepID=A0A368GS49_ANCCA|nr:SCP-like protein [Ancylostoma caninum]
MTDEMEKTAENMHNYYRRLIATGWAEDPKSIYAPRASKMNYVKFDCDNLAAPMKAAINKCQVPAEAPGQNVHVVGTWDISRQAALEEAITAWYEGLEKGGGLGEDNTYSAEVEANKMLKQYATLANDEVSAVGCAVKTCQAQGNTIVACKYDVQPFLDDPIYTVGKPCSECSKNTNNKQCEADSLKALCVA